MKSDAAASSAGKFSPTKCFQATYGTYGYRRSHAVLVRSGEQGSDELVRELMLEPGLVARQPRPWRPTTPEPTGPTTFPTS
ncbi:transposase [Amycolatopsis sp. H20-H5]|uniref:transposase n=1 Tax=Amycolatopsis sp. H20-H5 TaxID=3046309 RepID=UPI002DBD32F1|nr:transposase [Amycolatopsis sp. H20-H5]MEC3979074.1 transposase [Amycolatopsis sp. H20-H5]